MFSEIANWFTGSLTVRFDLPSHKGADLIFRSGIPCFDHRAENCAYVCSFALRDRKRLTDFCTRAGIPFTVLRESGFPFLLRRLIKRPGLILGAMLFCALLFACPNYVWEIKVHGNEALSDGQIVSILDSYGFSVGARHTSFDLHRLCNRIPIEHKEIAWISVNMMGGVAEVEVYEMRNKPEENEKEEADCVNLVARREGQIVRFELSSGRPAVNVGDTVGAGQLLVSGFSEKDGAEVLRTANGRVMARVVLEESVGISTANSVKSYEGGEILSKSVKILGKDIFFFKKGLQSDRKYDILKDVYRPTVLGVALPVTITAEKALFYEERTVVLSPEEAQEEARRLLYEKLRKETNEILTVDFAYELHEEEGKLMARCRAECIVDIAVRVPLLSDRS